MDFWCCCSYDSSLLNSTPALYWDRFGFLMMRGRDDLKCMFPFSCGDLCRIVQPIDIVDYPSYGGVVKLTEAFPFRLASLLLADSQFGRVVPRQEDQNKVAQPSV